MTLQRKCIDSGAGGKQLRALIAAMNPMKQRPKPLLKQWSLGLQGKDYTSHIAWWGEFHMYSNIFISQWVIRIVSTANHSNPIIC